MHFTDMEGPFKIFLTAGINILVDDINPCSHANPIHRDRVFLALSTRYGPHNKMKRNKMCQEKLARRVARIAEFYEVFVANFRDVLAYSCMSCISYGLSESTLIQQALVPTLCRCLRE